MPFSPPPPIIHSRGGGRGCLLYVLHCAQTSEGEISHSILGNNRLHRVRDLQEMGLNPRSLDFEAHAPALCQLLSSGRLCRNRMAEVGWDCG